MYKFVTGIRGIMRNHRHAIMALNALALVVVCQNVNAACIWLLHQPEIPEDANRFKKF